MIVSYKYLLVVTTCFTVRCRPSWLTQCSGGSLFPSKHGARHEMISSAMLLNQLRDQAKRWSKGSILLLMRATP